MPVGGFVEIEQKSRLLQPEYVVDGLPPLRDGLEPVPPEEGGCPELALRGDQPHLELHVVEVAEVGLIDVDELVLELDEAPRGGLQEPSHQESLLRLGHLVVHLGQLVHSQDVLGVEAADHLAQTIFRNLTHGLGFQVKTTTNPTNLNGQRSNDDSIFFFFFGHLANKYHTVPFLGD